MLEIKVNKDSAVVNTDNTNYTDVVADMAIMVMSAADYMTEALKESNNVVTIDYGEFILDDIVARFPKKEEETVEDDIPRFAVVGRPNAGKSSIINAFIGEDRYIVTDIAGTTRDSVFTRYNKFGFEFNAANLIKSCHIL